MILTCQKKKKRKKNHFVKIRTVNEIQCLKDHELKIYLKHSISDMRIIISRLLKNFQLLTIESNSLIICIVHSFIHSLISL